MTELKMYNLADDKEVHTGSGTLLCSVNDHNLKINYEYNILKDTIFFNYVCEYERDICQAFATELKDHIRHHWLSKLNTKKR